MWTMGSPFDAPHPRFQQAAAHLCSSIGPNAKKPPLSPSLPIDGEKSLQERGGSLKAATLDNFAACPSLEHSASLSNISRRRISTSVRSEFGSTHSLPFVQECASETKTSALGDANLQMPSCSSTEPLQAQSSLPSLPPMSSLLIPQPSGCRWLPRNLPGLLAASAMCALLVMSVVILWPPAGGAGSSTQPLQQPPSINLPRKFFDRMFNGDQPQQMEHFTAAQGAGWGTGFGLEDPSQPSSIDIIPSDDFTHFVSAHLGWEDEDSEPATMAEAQFEAAEVMNSHLPRAGGFGEGLVTIDAKGVDHMAHAISAAVATSAKTGAAANSEAVKIEGRKELETAGTTPPATAGTVAAKPAAASTGVIPQETIKSGNPLANSIGVADPLNLVDSDSTTPSGQSKARIAVQPGIAGGVNSNSNQMSGTTSSTQQMAGSFTTATATATSKPVIAVQPITGGGTNSNTQMAAGINSGSSIAGTSSTTTTASSLRNNKASSSASRGAGTSTVGSNQPLESVAANQVASVAQTDLSTSTTNHAADTSMGGSFKPLAG